MPKRAEREKRTCLNPECDNEFEAILNAAQANQRCCSRACARKVDNQARSARMEAEWLASDASLCPGCQEGRVPYVVRHTTKYCTPECRKTNGQKRQRDPNAWETKICETCENEFEHRRSTRNQGRFCSNRCAAKHTKKVLDGILLDSKWEALFYGLMGFLKIPCERYDREQGVEWKKGHWYAPDFWLPTHKIAIEIKGLEDTDDWEKWRAFDDHGTLMVMDHTVIEAWRKAENREWIIRSLDAIVEHVSLDSEIAKSFPDEESAR